jgi:hypothetical protein
MSEQYAMPQPFKDLLLQSQEKEFGIKMYVSGQSIPIVVVRFDEQIIEGYNQDNDAVLIRVDAVEAITR